MRGRQQGILAAVLIVGSLEGAAQGKQSCTIHTEPPTDADIAMAAGDYARAYQLYDAAVKAQAEDLPSVTGLIRAELGEEHLDDAAARSQRAIAAYPNDARVRDAAGEVSMRRGEPEEAARAYDSAMKLDPCLPQIHLDFARYLDLVAMHATARKQIELAHRLGPRDPVITAAWKEMSGPHLTPEQEITALKERLEEPALTPERRSDIARSIKLVEAERLGGCRPVGETKTATLKMVGITNGPSSEIYARGLDVELNGHKRLLEIDTGASGIVIGHAAAVSAGLVPEAEIKMGGIGDEGKTGGFVTHVDDLRIGGIEFKNCVVQVIEKKSVLEISGLIGMDVFENYLVTLDMPSREVRLSSLPKRPDLPLSDGSLKTLRDSHDSLARDTEEIPRDRYVAPEMQNWTRIYRIDHTLIVPTKIGGTPTKLFILDTGAGTPLISRRAAREVTGVYGSDMADLRGISGHVNKTSEASSVNLQFAGVQQRVNGMLAIDTGNLSRSLNLEVAGFLAFPTLTELVISLDYRDNLIHVVYDPEHGFHRH